MCRVLSLLLVSFLLLSVSIIPVYADHYSPYASVTSSTGNMSLLVDTMLNQDDFNVFQDWIGIRTGLYDYSVFYNIVGGKAVRLRYYGVGEGYNIVYYFSKSVDNNFSYNRGNYTIIGNTQDSLASSLYSSSLYHTILVYSVPFILVVLLFFVFRIRKRQGGLSL